MVGPLFGGGLLTISLRAPFVVYAVLLLVVVAFVWWFLRQSTLAARVAETSADFTPRDALRHRSYVAALGSSFANGWAVASALGVFAAGNVAMLMVSGLPTEVPWFLSARTGGWSTHCWKPARSPTLATPR